MGSQYWMAHWKIGRPFPDFDGMLRYTLERPVWGKYALKKWGMTVDWATYSKMVQKKNSHYCIYNFSASLGTITKRLPSVSFYRAVVPWNAWLEVSRARPEIQL